LVIIQNNLEQKHLKLKLSVIKSKIATNMKDIELTEFRNKTIVTNRLLLKRQFDANKSELTRLMMDSQSDFPASLEDVATVIDNFKILTDPKRNKIL